MSGIFFYIYIMRLLFIALCVSLAACSGTKDLPDLAPKDSTAGNKTPDKEVAQNVFEISAPIVKKPFINKGGKDLGYDEYYVQRSVQDYFIKFCESKVTKEELDKALDESKELIKALTIQAEIREGEWDICPDDPEHMQSRIGKYMVIHKIVE